jgi:putative Mg2+ transporter-C (MgtC) family protein
MFVMTDEIIRLLIALLVGGVIGIEREMRDKAAGFRTMILICTGAALFTMFSQKFGTVDPARIAASIVSGVGFLGAGAILRSEGRITGLTTAATIWLVAALGMGVGGGEVNLVVVAAILISVVLWFFPIIEVWIDSGRQMAIYEITIDNDSIKFNQINQLFIENKIKVRSVKKTKSDERMHCIWVTSGKPKNHRIINEILLNDSEVYSFGY